MGTAFICSDCGESVKRPKRGPQPKPPSCRDCYEHRRRLRRAFSGWVEKSCPQCGLLFSSAKNTYCSDECRSAARKSKLRADNHNKREASKVACNCERCGDTFSKDHTRPNQRFCSRSCARRADWETRRARERANDTERQPPTSVAYRVLRESGWVCSACGVDTPEVLRGTHALNAPEVDHIVPLSRGGNHSYENLQCLCKSCNSSKGAKLMSEWLPANDNDLQPLAA